MENPVCKTDCCSVSEKERKKVRKGYRRSQFIIFVARNLLSVPVKKILNIECGKTHISEEPFIIMANHGDNLDAAVELLEIRNYIRFVMSDHLTRNPLLRGLVKFLASPIIYHREKGSDALYDEVVANLNSGINVAIYIEGGKTNNGKTGYISKRNAQMVKDGNCGLVTYRNKGGYMKSPRWAINKRSGKLSGEVVNIYTKADIDRMTVDEIYMHILDDLSFNAYDEQRINPKKYIAEKPAESAEIMLYVCPKCKKIGTMKSTDDTLYCKECDFKAVIDDYGFWHSKDMPFDDIVRWDDFQKSVLKELADSKKGTADVLFSDNGQIIYTLENENRVLKNKNSELTLYGNRLKISSNDFNVCIPIEKIKVIKTASRMTLLIITDEAYYEIHSKEPHSAIKYVVATRYLLGKENF